MLNNDTHRQPERNPDAHAHEGDDFCLDCILNDLLHRDFRYDLALLTCIDLRHLAEHRAAAIGKTWRDIWGNVLDAEQLEADLSSPDPERRALILRAQQTVGDFLIYRRSVNKEITIKEAMELMMIEQRTNARLAEIERDGSEPELLGYGDLN